MAWEFDSATPLYAQLASRVRADIVCGVYKKGDKLPAVRELALAASVNPNTMQRAFACLEDEGLVITAGTLGRFVTDDDRVIAEARERIASFLVADFRALSKNYGSFTALSNFNLSLPAGRIIGLLGPNGSGKTTLIKMAAGLLTPTYGEILIDGRPVGIDTKKIVSYLPERTYFNESMTVRETIDFFEDFYEDFSRAKAEDMLARLHVDTGRRLKTLSKGNKEKVQLVLVMSRHARLYLLDEPIGGVDPATRDYILDTIVSNYNQDSTVLISTHLIADIEKVLDEFVFINMGNLVMHSSADEVREERGKSIDELFREVFRC